MSGKVDADGNVSSPTIALAGVHDHPCRGLFVILDGTSVHARYGFDERWIKRYRLDPETFRR